LPPRISGAGTTSCGKWGAKTRGKQKTKRGASPTAGSAGANPRDALRKGSLIREGHVISVGPIGDVLTKLPERGIVPTCLLAIVGSRRD